MSRQQQPVMPVVTTFEPGQEYRLCGCRRCSTLPWAGNACTSPQTAACERKALVWLCSCKRSKTFPYCDGAHNPRNNMTLWQAIREIAGGLFRKK